MSKGLKAFEDIKTVMNKLFGGVERCEKALDIIEKELKDKEKFEELVNTDLDLFMKMVDIKGLIEDYQKFSKALDIIKNIGILKPYETIGGQCWLETMCDATKITKDNYDLLKEVLL
jgi:hypothetical protein